MVHLKKPCTFSLLRFPIHQKEWSLLRRLNFLSVWEKEKFGVSVNLFSCLCFELASVREAKATDGNPVPRVHPRFRGRGLSHGSRNPSFFLRSRNRTGSLADWPWNDAFPVRRRVLRQRFSGCDGGALPCRCRGVNKKIETRGTFRGTLRTCGLDPRPRW